MVCGRFLVPVFYEVQKFPVSQTVSCLGRLQPEEAVCVHRRLQQRLMRAGGWRGQWPWGCQGGRSVKLT